MCTVGHNANKRKTSHSNWKGKAAQGKSDRGSKRKVEYEIAPTSDPKEAVCFYYNTKGNWKRSCPKYLKDLKDEKIEWSAFNVSKDMFNRFKVRGFGSLLEAGTKADTKHDIEPTCR
nr:hypothetical protein [Tanacetum cinerariifolium]